MSTVIESFLAELEWEAETTRLLLARIPPDRLAWRPHPRSMTLGQLALHVVQIPGAFADWLRRDTVDMTTVEFSAPSPQFVDDVRNAFEQSVDGARRWLATLDDASMATIWRATADGADLFAAPRMNGIRALMFNHWYHHRGQLAVYLRLLDVPLPPIYGPSADENPFARAGSRFSTACAPPPSCWTTGATRR